MLQVPIWETQLCSSGAEGCRGGSRPPCPPSQCDTAQRPKQRMLHTNPAYFFFKVLVCHDPDTNRKGLLSQKYLRPYVSPPSEG